MEENNKEKGEREKRKRSRGKTRGSMKKTRQLLGCLIEYGELFELCPERCIFLLFFCFFGGLGIVLDKPGEELCIVDLLAEHLFAAGGTDRLAIRFCQPLFN